MRRSILGRTPALTTVVAGIFLFAAGSTAAFAAPESGSTINSDANVNESLHSDADVNDSLDSMAKLFAAAVTDENLRQQIHDEVAQRFDGDTDTLYSTLANTSDVRKAVASKYSSRRKIARSDSLSAVDRLASDIPRFQVAVPAKFDTWDPATYTPLVAYVPAGVEDTKLKTITAYDAKGTAHKLDAQVAPSQPVIVLGLNERTDNSGKLLQKKSESSDPRTSTSGLTSRARSYQVRMVQVHLIKDHEPWPKGDAEISVHAQGCGLWYTDINWSNLNDDGDYWSPGSSERVLGSTSCGAYFYWWENDGSSWDFTLSYRGVSLGVHMDDGDDLIGGVYMKHGLFAGGTNNKRVWSSLVQWTD